MTSAQLLSFVEKINAGKLIKIFCKDACRGYEYMFQFIVQTISNRNDKLFRRKTINIESFKFKLSFIISGNEKDEVDESVCFFSEGDTTYYVVKIIVEDVCIEFVKLEGA